MPQTDNPYLVPIEKATADQVRNYGVVILGLDLSVSDTKPQMLSKLKAAGFEGDEIEDVKALAKGRFERHGRVNSGVIDPGNPPRTVTVFIDIEDKAGGDQPVPVAVNGRAMLIARGEDQRVPYHYFVALNNARQETYEDAKDGSGLVFRGLIPRYPFRVIELDYGPNRAPGRQRAA